MVNAQTRMSVCRLHMVSNIPRNKHCNIYASVEWTFARCTSRRFDFEKGIAIIIFTSFFKNISCFSLWTSSFFEVEHSTWEQQIIVLPIHRIVIINWVFSPSFLFHNASYKFLWFNHFEFKDGLSHRSSYWLYFPVKAPERKNSAGSSGATSGLRVVHWRGTRMSGAGRARRSVAFGDNKDAVSKTHT